MQYFILSDVHSDYESLVNCLLDYALNFKPSKRTKDKIKVILAASGRKLNPEFESQEAEAERSDKVVCLGDIIGYGPEPNECLEAIFKVADEILLGNHELRILTGNFLIERDDTRIEIQKIWQWTSDNLSAANRTALEMLDAAFFFKKYIFNENGITFSHGLPLEENPVDHYYGGTSKLKMLFAPEKKTAGIMVMGHEHVPAVIRGLESIGGVLYPLHLLSDYVKKSNGFNATIDFFREEQVLISVPSVSAPRDNYSNSGYAVLYPEEKRVVFRRIPYDEKRQDEKVRAILGKELKNQIS